MTYNQSFTLTLPSNVDSLRTYPNNTASDYHTLLHMPLRLEGKWRCGLTSISFPRSWKNVATEEEGTFYIIDTKNENSLQTVSIEPDRYPSVENLVAKLNTAVGHADVKFEMPRNYGKAAIRIKNGKLLLLGKTLSGILGFDTAAPQQHEKTLYDRYNFMFPHELRKVQHPLADSPRISVFWPGNTLHDITNIPDMLKNIEEKEPSFLNQQQRADNTTYIAIHKMYLAIPKTASKEWGITGFSQWMPLLGPENNKKGTAFRAIYEPDIDASVNNVYIYANFISPVLVGDSQTPLLRYVTIQNTEDRQIHINFEKPFYHPIRSNYLRDCHLQLRDGSGRLLSFVSGETVVELEFRPISYSG